MFNSETYVNNIIHNKIQQVSGSLIKTDPNSVFIRFDKGSRQEERIFNTYPKIKLYDSDKIVKVTVLQVMLSHDNSYICEVIIHEKAEQYYD